MCKYPVVLLLLFCFTPAIHAQKTRFGQVPRPIGSPIHAHIYASHIRNSCNNNYLIGFPPGCAPALFVDVLLDGEKIELVGPVAIEKHDFSVLVPGDYETELTKDAESRDRMAIHQEYNIKMPDGSVWHGIVTGVSE